MIKDQEDCIKNFNTWENKPVIFAIYHIQFLDFWEKFYKKRDMFVKDGVYHRKGTNFHEKFLILQFGKLN